MTKEEILTMDPSVQMGNLVATEVMKWHREGDHWVTPEGFWVKAEGLDGWYPWRDISAAWQVVEKISSEVPQFIVEVWTSQHYFGPHHKNRCLIWGARRHECEVDAKSAPEAICKAALLAMTFL